MEKQASPVKTLAGSTQRKINFKIFKNIDNFDYLLGFCEHLPNLRTNIKNYTFAGVVGGMFNARTFLGFCLFILILSVFFVYKDYLSSSRGIQ